MPAALRCFLTTSPNRRAKVVERILHAANQSPRLYRNDCSNLILAKNGKKGKNAGKYAQQSE
jgi:hypothetical protein